MRNYLDNIDGLDPIDLGLPEKFERFNSQQTEAINEFLQCPTRWLQLCLPTGSGKSLAAMGMALASGMKTVILTGTKGLMDQYMGDFGPKSRLGLVRPTDLIEIKGKDNYECAKHARYTCRTGEIVEDCAYSGTEACTHRAAKRRAEISNVCVTNYAYWVRANRKRKKQGCYTALDQDEFNGVELLILDEAHHAMEHLASAIRITVRESWMQHMGNSMEASVRDVEDMGQWMQFASGYVTQVESELANTKARKRARSLQNASNKRIQELDELLEALREIEHMHPDDWVCTMRAGTAHGRVWEFENIWPAKYAESLWCGVGSPQHPGRIVLMSATLRPIVSGLLGIPRDEVTYREWGRVFPAERGPVYHVPTVRMNHKVSDEGLAKWVARIDEIIGSRLPEKGIIHTVSYARQQYLLLNSKYTERMISNTTEPDSPSATDAMRLFKESKDKEGVILVSPSFSTGWDFPGAHCRWQIICKVAFPDLRGKVMQARKARNDQYPNYLAMQDLVQACGRGTRSMTDWCETFIVDDSITWFMRMSKSMAPRWFTVYTVGGVPKRAEFDRA